MCRDVTTSLWYRRLGEPCSGLPQRLSGAAGITFLNAGPDPLNKQDYLNYHIRKESGSSFHVLRNVVFPQVIECAKRLGNELSSNYLQSAGERPDIIVADYWHAPYFFCLGVKWGVPFISLHTSVEFLNLPYWPFPIYGSGHTDNLTFLQRFVLVFSYALQRVLLWHTTATMTELGSKAFNCTDSGEHNHAYHVAEGHSPLIVSSAIGFEYPRSQLPLVHYVGPLLLREEKKLSGELKKWLESKAQNSVIYISMGSGARLTKSMGSALISGILQTNFSVIWSLRESNREILKGHSLNPEKFHLSEWVPQQAILRHKAAAIAVLHAGMGGVSEALDSKVPLIVIPSSLDQFDIAARVQNSGAGIILEGRTLTSNIVQRAVSNISSPAYKRTVEKLHKVFLHAGGANRAAELVEFYEEVGYDHLVPAYLKYKWSWVQFYNLDVYAIVSSLLVVLVLIVFKSCAFCRHQCSKIKTE